ncbi:MAG: FAD-binding protein, partial [Bacteroidales bacterium]|nr:FAD-binding protein [Bacteroidales bacterium]
MLRIGHNVDMTKRNTFGMKVRAATVVEYSEIADLEQFRNSEEYTSPKGPVLHIGAGSNLLFTKEFFPGILLHSNIQFIKILNADAPSSASSHYSWRVKPMETAEGEVECETEDYVEVEVGAGVEFDHFCFWAAGKGLWGVENLSGIPGETGAAAVQNIGAYGMEVCNAILSVNCFDMTLGRETSFSPDDCEYGYRTSLFKTHRKGRYVVTSVTFRLHGEPRPVLDYGSLREAIGSANPTPKLIREAVLRARREKLPDPKEVGSAGSFFKNPVVPRSVYEKAANIAKFEFGGECSMPFFDVGSGFVKIPAAWLIEHCGWKGCGIGNAAVWKGQPLVLVNATGQASAAE